MECSICYLPILNKVSLSCSHELCVKCLVNILKIKKDYFTCPMYREKYKDIYFELPAHDELDYESLPSPPLLPADEYSINVIEKDERHTLDNILRLQFSNYVWYEIEVYNKKLDFFVSLNESLDISSFNIKTLVTEFLLNALCMEYEVFVQRIKSSDLSCTFLNYKISNIQTYLLDYYDIIVTKLTSI